jgi:hypothetical protein
MAAEAMNKTAHMTRVRLMFMCRAHRPAMSRLGRLGNVYRNPWASHGDVR